MSARTTPARRAAFLRALGETGNQTLAAERAKVSRAWVQLHRSSDPGFRADAAAAVAAAKARLRAAEGVGPDRGWRAQAGEELAVRGSNGRRCQIARARLKQWTPRVEKRFLEVLAGCCNVRRACAAVGLSVQSAYGHRRRWADFAERWDVALAMGYDRLEYSMVAHAGRTFDPDEPAEDAMVPELPVAPITVADALQLLRLHRYRVHGVGRALPGRRPRPRSLDEVRGSILRKLEAMAGAERHAARCADRDAGAAAFLAEDDDSGDPDARAGDAGRRAR